MNNCGIDGEVVYNRQVCFGCSDGSGWSYFLVVLLVMIGAAAGVVFAVPELLPVLVVVAEGAQAKQIHDIVIRARTDKGIFFNIIFP